MSGVPADVLAQRVVSSLERVQVAVDAADLIEARYELVRTRHWLDQLREAI